MKMVSAIVRPSKLEAILAALQEISVERMTICDAQSYDEPGEREGLHRVVHLEIVVNDDFAERTLATIQKAARTGDTGADGDGKLFVFPVVETIRLDDEGRGPQAV